MFNWKNTEKIPPPGVALICTLTGKGKFSIFVRYSIVISKLILSFLTSPG